MVMKNSLDSKGYLLIVILVLLCGTMQAQLVPKTAEEKKAVELVKAYQAELEMTVEQASSMYTKISENLVLVSEIKESDKPAEEKQKLLANLDQQEIAFMESVLDHKQLREYKKLRKTLQ